MYPSLSGSKWLDMALIIILGCVILYGSPRLKVYYRVNAARVEAARIFPDGSRVVVNIPDSLKRSGNAYSRMDKWLEVIERRIHKYMEHNINIEEIPAGESYEWEIRYSVNSPKLDQKKILNFP